MYGRNLDKSVVVARAMAPVAVTTSFDGIVVDTMGYDELRCDLNFGAITGTPTVDVNLEHGDESDGSDMAEVVGTDFVQTTVADTGAGDQFGAVRAHGLKRYVRIEVVVGGGSPSAVMAAWFTLGGAKEVPVSGYAGAAFDLLPAVPA